MKTPGPERAESLDDNLVESARERFDLEALIEAGRPYLPEGAKDLVNQDGYRVTCMAAGIFSDPDGYNCFEEWVQPIRDAARQRLLAQSMEERRAYAIEVHIRGAQEHSEQVIDQEKVMQMVVEEQYDRDYGWPFVLLYNALNR